MRLLLLSFYYPPDLAAGSFRAAALVDALRALPDVEIDVLTTMPNRYHSFDKAAEARDEAPGLTVRRIPLPPHRSGLADQARAFAQYARGVRRIAASERWDGVVATSSRLMTAALGAHVAHKLRIPLYLDIRDLFADTMADVFRGRAAAAALPLIRRIERRTLRRAARVNVVSAGFLPTVRRIAPEHAYRVFTNGVDDDFVGGIEGADSGPRTRPLIVYAGNIGEGQGLHRIIPEAAALLADRADFRIIGDGGRHAELASAIKEAGVTNVELLPPVPRAELRRHYAEADVLFLHLNDHAAFRKVLPSKVFEYAATGKPVVAGVAGYAAEFLAAEVPGAAVFAPCDAGGLARALDRVAGQRTIDRSAFVAKYGRRRIMADMARDIVAMVEDPAGG